MNPFQHMKEDYTKIPTEVFRKPILNPTEKAVLGYLASCGQNIYPSLSKIARETGIGRNTVCKTLRTLKGMNAISWIRGNRGGNNNLYTIYPIDRWKPRSVTVEPVTSIKSDTQIKNINNKDKYRTSVENEPGTQELSSSSCSIQNDSIDNKESDSSPSIEAPLVSNSHYSEEPPSKQEILETLGNLVMNCGASGAIENLTDKYGGVWKQIITLYDVRIFLKKQLDSKTLEDELGVFMSIL